MSSIARVQCSVGDKTVFTVCGPLVCASRSVQVENSLLLKDVMTQLAFCPRAPHLITAKPLNSIRLHFRLRAGANLEGSVSEIYSRLLSGCMKCVVRKGLKP